MENVALARIISTDWMAPCRTSFFCFAARRRFARTAASAMDTGRPTTRTRQATHSWLATLHALFLGYLWLLVVLPLESYERCHMNVLARFLELYEQFFFFLNHMNSRFLSYEVVRK